MNGLMLFSGRLAAKTLNCFVLPWSMLVRLLIWEECYYEPVIYSTGEHGIQATNNIYLLVTKMMKDNYVNLLGEGLVGRVAFTRNHQWIISDNKMLDVHPLEVSNELCTQFSAGIQTIAVIPVYPHGVVQFGSSSTIMENIGFVNDVEGLISQLGCVPGALLSENFMKNEGTSDSSPSHHEPIRHMNSVSAHSSGKSKVTECNQQGHSPQASGSSGHISFSFNRHIVDNVVASGSTRVMSDEDQCQAKVIPLMKQNPSFETNQQIVITGVKSITGASLYNQNPKKELQNAFGSCLLKYDPLRSMKQHILSDADAQTSIPDAHFSCTRVDKQNLDNELFQALSVSSEEACVKPSSRDDLFDIVGMDFKSTLCGGTRTNFVINGVEANPPNLNRNDSVVLEPFSVYEGESDSGIYSSTPSDHLLDAVVSKVYSSSGQIADDNMSCSSLTKTNSSSSMWANKGIHLMQKELIGVPKSLKNEGLTNSCSFKSGIFEDGGNLLDTSSIISSQISSWNEKLRKESGGASQYGKKADETSKSNRKRLKPGENPRPRPKDRQMIQDRVKELREIIPNGAKCSIDALLERTVKHMLFLQSVTKHADKLKQTGESKIVSKDGGLLLRDNFEGGATWAYEVGSQSMVCPIIVEDLNSPRQMLVEMLCEERGSFLEIADVVKGLGLTILKGVMESHNGKIWAHFTVEANRDVTRMEIFISLISLFDPDAKNGASAAGCDVNGNISVHEQSFNQLATNPATFGPHNMIQ
ncbi:transcription factor LHW [Tanacetum coccineum]|uniref:Transcription factor LHW n=1 Tax=Tanacetum coccineum TaxID=301880 RepID=A0ABQ5FR88_9ASTR